MLVVHLGGNCCRANVGQIVPKDTTKQNMVVKSAIILVGIAMVMRIIRFWGGRLNRNTVVYFLGCKMQEGKRRIDVEALLLSAQPVSTLQIVNPFNFITGLAIIAFLCIIILFIAIFIILQVRSEAMRRHGIVMFRFYVAEE